MRALVTLALLVVGACSGVPGGPTGIASPTATPTALPTPTPTPSPTPSPTPTPLSVELLELTRRVPAGDPAEVRIQTEAGANCDITVTYDSGPSQASGLVSKEANARGRVTWRWTVGRRTAAGTYPIDISCSLGRAHGTLSLEFAVR